MSETPLNTDPDNLTAQLPPASEGYGHEPVPEAQPSLEVQREAYAGWLERRGIDPATTPRLTMGPRELLMFSNAPPDYLPQVREIYSLPQDDQADATYAFVELYSEDPTQPTTPGLIDVTEAEFGTLIDFERVATDFQQPESEGPDSPPAPGSPEGTVRTVDITDTIAQSSGELHMLATEMMKGQTVDPLSPHYGDIAVRAGDVAEWQQDAYVWTKSPFGKSVELTIAFPGKYDSVCVVRGEMREAGNGKAGMAQIDNPQVVFKIEGENLRYLQQVYQRLYHEPDFALTEQQRRGRDELFNDYLAAQISEEARKNRATEQARRDDEMRMSQPKVRAIDPRR